jgi:hypothetical protein
MGASITWVHQLDGWWVEGGGTRNAHGVLRETQPVDIQINRAAEVSLMVARGNVSLAVNGGGRRGSHALEQQPIDLRRYQ